MLYQSTRSRLLAYALRRTAPEDAPDVIADTFAIAWQRIDDVPVGEAEILWLYATARRVIANYLRRARHRAGAIERLRTEVAVSFAGTVDAHNEDATVAAQVLAQMSEDDREILMLVAWEGLNSAELACVLGCSPTAARIRLHRARVRLASGFTGFRSWPKQEHSSRQVRPGAIFSEGVVEEAQE